jgi:hypothetical protein
VAKAWDVPGLAGDARFRQAAGRVILTRWREMMSSRDGTLLGEDIEELHSMRVSSRRLRAAMDAFEGAFPRRPALRAVGDHGRARRRARLDVPWAALAVTGAARGRLGDQGLIAATAARRRGPKIAA